MSKKLEDLLAAQENAAQKKREFEQQEKRIKKQIADEKCKKRTHRLCERGAIWKSCFRSRFCSLMKRCSGSWTTLSAPHLSGDRLRDILDATHGCPRGGNPIADKISNSFERRRTAFIQPKVRSTMGQSRILRKLQNVVQIEQNLCKTGATQAAAALFIK